MIRLSTKGRYETRLMLNLTHQYNKDNKTIIYNIIKEERMIIAEFAIFPTSEGTSVSRYVREVVKVIENSGLNSVTGGMATTIEAPDLKTLFDVIEKTHKVLVDMGVKRIHVDLHIDHRLDRESSIESKLEALGKA